jgi:hypothetical protein
MRPPISARAEIDELPVVEVGVVEVAVVQLVNDDEVP